MSHIISFCSLLLYNVIKCINICKDMPKHIVTRPFKPRLPYLSKSCQSGNLTRHSLPCLICHALPNAISTHPIKPDLVCRYIPVHVRPIHARTAMPLRNLSERNCTYPVCHVMPVHLPTNPDLTAKTLHNISIHELSRPVCHTDT